MAKRVDPIYMVNGATGIYAGRELANKYDLTDWGIPEKYIAILKAGPDAGPDDTAYFDAFVHVLDNATIVKDGVRWFLMQGEGGGDIFATTTPEGLEEAYEDDDKEKFGNIKAAEIADDIIKNPRDFGYEHFALTDDGGLLCNKCVKAERDLIVNSYEKDGWHVVASDWTSNYDLSDVLICDNCSKYINGDPEDQ